MRAYALFLVAYCWLISVGASLAAERATKELDGTWIVESVVRDPKEKDAGEGKGLRVIVSGENVIVKNRDEEKSLGRLAIKLDAAKKPKTVDLTPKDETGVVLAVYELDRDRLRICWGSLEKGERPTEFTAKPGSGQTVVTLKRAKQ